MHSLKSIIADAMYVMTHAIAGVYGPYIKTDFVQGRMCTVYFLSMKLFA